MTRFSSALVWVLLFLVFSGCGKKKKEIQPGSDKNGETVVFTTFLPVYSFTSLLLHDLENVRVEIMVKTPMFDPHYFKPNATDIKRLAEADIVVRHGLNIDKFLDESTLNKAGISETVELITLTDAIPAHMVIKDVRSKEIDNKPVEPGSAVWDTLNPYLWVSPAMASRETKYLAFTLGRYLPDHRETIYARETELLARLDSLNLEFKSLLKETKNNRVILNVDNMRWFSRDYGFAIVGIIERSDGTESGPKDLHLLQQRSEMTNPAVILVDKGVSSDKSKYFSEQTKIPIIVFDTVMRGVIKPNAYFDSMYENIKTLKEYF